MAKSILYKLFGLGKIPKKMLPVLQAEGILVSDEGIAGRIFLRKVKGPGRRHYYRTECFPGSLVITEKRVIAYAFWKCKINVPVDDHNIARIHYDMPETHLLLISFEASDFMPGWEGVIELKFKTNKALQFRNALANTGAKEGRAKAA